MFHAISPSSDEDTESPSHNEVYMETTFLASNKKALNVSTSRNRVTPRYAVRVGHAPHTPRIQAPRSWMNPVKAKTRSLPEMTRELELLPRKGLPGRESRPNMPVCSLPINARKPLNPEHSFCFALLFFAIPVREKTLLQDAAKK